MRTMVVILAFSTGTGCQTTQDYWFEVEGQADGPRLTLDPDILERFDVAVTSEDWHLPSVADVVVTVSDPLVETSVIDSTGAETAPSEVKGRRAVYQVDLDSPGYRFGVTRHFEVALWASEAVDARWSVHVSMTGITHDDVVASYEVAITRVTASDTP